MSLAVIMLVTLGAGALLAALLDSFNLKKKEDYYRPRRSQEQIEFNSFLRNIRGKSARI